MSAASTAVASLDKAAWAATKASERLSLLKRIQLNLDEHQETLVAAEALMKNNRMGESMYKSANCKVLAVAPMGNNISGAIQLYSALACGKDFKPTVGKITKVSNSTEDLYDIPVAPRNVREKIIYGKRFDRLRVEGVPTQKGPYDKETKLIAILGAGNYSCPIEIIKAAFFDGCVVVHKPHPLNEDCDKVWAKILEPLVAAKALSFCAPDQGPAMTTDSRVDAIYFTGGAESAKAILKCTKAPLVCESGGVNPTLIVPGDRPWTAAELTHHAQQIVSMGKMNGGAICARPQLVVTCKNWSQREDFIRQLEVAIEETTFACGSYYPGSKERMEAFLKAYPNGKLIQPENGAYKNADVLLVTGDKEESYSSQHEAFCQVFTEVPLNTEPNATDFLGYAVKYCNTKVLGTLVAGIILDETTRKNHEQELQLAVTDLKYGTIGVNLLPPHAFTSPYLIWGGHDDEGTLISGRGHFGNVYGFENADKSILEDAFVSPGQVKYTSKEAIHGLFTSLTNYSVWDSWWNLIRFAVTAIAGTLKSKDW